MNSLPKILGLSALHLVVSVLVFCVSFSRTMRHFDFPTPQKIKTRGGEITVSEIVVGLNRDDYASSLFTIDDAGRVVGHSKYAGERCIQLLNAVKQFTPDA